MRIWGLAGREGKSTEISWNTQSALVYMIADLVAGSDGVVLADSRAAMVAQFETPAKALNAAKQIQLAVLDFARHRPDGRYAAAIVIYAATERGPLKGPGSAGANAPGASLLQHAKPAQVLMTESAYETLREMPGLRFRPVTPTPGSDSAVRGRELVWRTPEPASRSDEALPQATQIFVQNSEPLPVKVLPMPGSILQHPDGRTATIPDTAGDELQLDQPVDVRSPWLKRSLVAVGGVIVFAAALGLIVYPRKATVVEHPSQQEQPQPEPEKLPPAETAPSNIAPAVNPAVINSEAPESATPPVAEEPTPKPAKPQRIQREKPATKIVSDFSARDIPFLLRKAEQDAGAGKYDAAQREYRIVLQLDPNNASAKQGLHRLELSR
jgi:hypothetical protein